MKPLDLVVDGLPRCEKEIGSVRKGWHLCQKRASVYSRRQIGVSTWVLFYCQQHQQHATKTDTPHVRILKTGPVDVEKE